MKNIKLVLLDAGHGTKTPGKRSPKFEDGSQYFEGVGNREIREEVRKLLAKEKIRFLYVNPGDKDMGLFDRCATANAFARKYGKDQTLFISIHSDAYGKEWNDAHGISCYTSPGQTASDVVAEEWYKQAKLMWPDAKLRTSKKDGDLDKESRFAVLTKTQCPAILIENFFMTNKKECEFLRSKKGKREIAQVIVNTVKQFICQ
jgi:N-acetylmuramoyl-L-alanine amidase